MDHGVGVENLDYPRDGQGEENSPETEEGSAGDDLRFFHYGMLPLYNGQQVCSEQGSAAFGTVIQLLVHFETAGRALLLRLPGRIHIQYRCQSNDDQG